MTAVTITLTEFLLARIGEREADVRARETYAVGHTDRCIFEGGFEGTVDCDCGAVDRALAECEAKRRIVEMCKWGDWTVPGKRFLGEPGEDLPSDVLQLLALPYADHEDYDDSWRP